MVLFGDQSVTTLALELDHIVGMQFVEQSRFRLTSQPLSWIAPGRVLRNAAAIRLIEGWLADDSGYDEAVWPSVKAAIEENRMSSRRRFRE